MTASFIAAWFVIRHVPQFLTKRESGDNGNTIIAPVLFFIAFFALLLIAYLTHQQPIVFPRYGLIMFTLGLPILAWTFLSMRKLQPRFARHVLASIVVICALDASIQLAGAVGVINQYRAQRAAADYLRDHFDAHSNARVFCDDGTVRVLSGIPEPRFVTSANSPNDRERFVEFLKDQKVQYLVMVKPGDSTPARVFPDAESNEPPSLELLMHSYTDFIRTDIWLYRVTESEAADRATRYYRVDPRNHTNKYDRIALFMTFRVSSWIVPVKTTQTRECSSNQSSPQHIQRRL
jgi:hypothetical protein